MATPCRWPSFGPHPASPAPSPTTSLPTYTHPCQALFHFWFFFSLFSLSFSKTGVLFFMAISESSLIWHHQGNVWLQRKHGCGPRFPKRDWHTRAVKAVAIAQQGGWPSQQQQERETATQVCDVMAIIHHLLSLSTMKEKLPSECWMTTDAPLNRWDWVDSCAWGFVCADISCHTHKSALPLLSRHFWLGRILFDDSLSELRAKFQQRSSHQREVHRSRVITPLMSQDELPEFLIGGDSNRRRHQKTHTHKLRWSEITDLLRCPVGELTRLQNIQIEKKKRWTKVRTSTLSCWFELGFAYARASKHPKTSQLFESAQCQKKQTRNNSHNSIFLAALPLRAKHVRRALGPHSCD